MILKKVRKKERLGLKFLKLQINNLDEITYVKKEHIGGRKPIQKCTNEKLVLNEAMNSYVYVIMFLFMTLFFLVFSWGNKFGLLGLVLPSILIAISSSIWLIFKPKQLIIFNRKKGTITYPGFLWSKRIYTKFDDVAANISNSGKIAVLKLYHPNLFTYRSINTATSNLIAQWSYFVWYMDKNRPLPPGSAFDNYREVDFEFRKSEGFPLPK